MMRASEERAKADKFYDDDIKEQNVELIILRGMTMDSSLRCRLHGGGDRRSQTQKNKIFLAIDDSPTPAIGYTLEYIHRVLFALL
jgi:hypothetical protein